MMDYIPTEITENILSKLPVISLIRFQSVCKSWHQTINNPRFLRTHHDHTIKQPQNDDLYTMRLNKYNNPHIEVIKLQDQEFVSCTFDITHGIALPVGSCHCIILLRKFYPHFFVLLNPITRKRHKISCLHDYPSCYGLYHDPKSDDYKIAILYNEIDNHTTSCFRVCSCKNTTWQEPKPLPSAITLNPQSMLVFVDGCFYQRGDGEVLCFDVRDEKVSTFPFPNHVHTNRVVLLELSRNLCMYRACTSQQLSGQWIQLWKMEKHGEKYSWRKLMDLMTESEHVILSNFVCLSKNDDVVVTLSRDTWKDEHVIYDHGEKKLKKFDNGGYKASLFGSHDRVLKTMKFK